MFEDDFGDIFDESDGGRSAKGMADVLAHLTHMIEHEQVPIGAVLDGLLNLLHPGSTERSHDVLQLFRVCMFLQDQGDVLEHFGSLWLTEFPWGIGFHISVHREWKVNEMSFDTKRAVIRSLCAVMQAGGINAELTSNDLIKVTKDDGGEQNIDIDQVVGQFRAEIDQELGPDAPTEPKAVTSDEETQQVTDWMKRWLPDQ